MNTFQLTLDLDKGNSLINSPVIIRQGDKNGTEVRAEIYDHGETLSLSGYTWSLCMRLPNSDQYYRTEATFNNGVATANVNENSAAAIVGTTELVHFEAVSGTKEYSTQDFTVIVLPDPTADAEVAEPYDSRIEQALAELDDATGRIAAMVQDATEEYLEAHPELTTTVEDNSLTDAKLIQHGGILDRVARLWHRLDNLLTATPAEADTLTVSDAAKTPLAGLALYGRSTQSGTPTPSAPVAIQSVTPNLAKGYAATATNNGITYVTTEGGATTISGTASGGSAMPLQTAGTFALPAGTYTLVMGGELTASGTGARAQLVKVVDSSISNVNATPYTTNGGTVYVTFTTTEDMTAFVRIGVNSGSVVSGTLQFALYEGSVAYTPTTCGGVGLWARGRNLYQQMLYEAGTTQNRSGVTYTYHDGGSFTASGTATANASSWGSTTATTPSLFVMLPAGTYTVAVPTPFRTSVRKLVNGTNTSVGSSNSGVLTFTLDEEAPVMCYAFVASGATVTNAYGWVMLTAGSTPATEYVPYAESTTPIDLQGHALRSLPDGTRDEVNVDQYGHAVLTQRVKHIEDVSTLPVSGFNANSHYFAFSIASNLGVNTNNGHINIMSSGYVGKPTLSPPCVYVTGYGGTLLFGDERFTGTQAEALAMLSGVSVQYELATPVTIDLGTIDPVALQGPDMTAQSVPTAPFRLTYERDLNATLARLEAAIADAATA